MLNSHGKLKNLFRRGHRWHWVDDKGNISNALFPNKKAAREAYQGLVKTKPSLKNMLRGKKN